VTVQRREELEGRKASDEALSKTYDFLTEGSYGLEMATAPKAMADVVESLAGAIYIDSGCQLAPVWKVLLLYLPPPPPHLSLESGVWSNRFYICKEIYKLNHWNPHMCTSGHWSPRLLHMVRYVEQHDFWP